MKKKNGFILKTIIDKNIIVPFGEESLNLNGVITLNETGKFLWENMDDEFTPESISQLLIDKYGISKNLADTDAERFISQLKEAGCIAE